MNPYYNPEEMGLTIIAQIEYSDMDYNFDTRVVWKHTSGKYYTARDSGCSCPTPFEDYASLEKLEPFVKTEIQKEVSGELAQEYHHVSAEDAQEFLAKIRKIRVR